MQVDHVPEPVREVRLLEEGEAALQAIDAELGLAFDEWDMQYYYKLFTCAHAPPCHYEWPSPRLAYCATPPPFTKSNCKALCVSVGWLWMHGHPSK
jgi:hypothetical protein